MGSDRVTRYLVTRSDPACSPVGSRDSEELSMVSPEQRRAATNAVPKTVDSVVKQLCIGFDSLVSVYACHRFWGLGATGGRDAKADPLVGYERGQGDNR